MQLDSWMFLLAARCNIVRSSRETKKKRLSYRKMYGEEFVWQTSLFLATHAPSNEVFLFRRFFCLLPPVTQAAYLLNGPYKDTQQ